MLEKGYLVTVKNTDEEKNFYCPTLEGRNELRSTFLRKGYCVISRTLVVDDTKPMLNLL